MPKLLLAVLLSLTFLLHGCSVLDYAKSNPTTAYISVQYATAKIVQNDPVRADRVITQVTWARQFVDNSTRVSVAHLFTEVRQSIPWADLNPEDQLLINLVLQEAQRDVTRRIGEGALDKAQQVTLLTLLDWIESAATVYGG